MRTEQLIFSQLLLNEEYVRKVFPHVKAEYFSSDEDKNFFKIYSRYFLKHNAVPSKQAMRVEIENLKGSADVYKSLLEIINSTEIFTEKLDYLVSETEKFCKTRAIYNALREAVLIADGTDTKKSQDSIPSILQSALSVCFDTSVGHDYFADADERYEYYHRVDIKIPTGLPEFDKVTKGGFSRKTLNLLLAPPHGGKSLGLVNIGSGAILAGFNVLCITLEMSDKETAKRYDVNLMNLDFDMLETLPPAVFQNKVSSIQKQSRGKLIVKEYPTSAAHAGHFRSLLEELKTKQNFVPDMLIVDYLGITASEKYKASTGANSYTMIKSTGEELRALAVEYDMAVVSAIQTNRTGIGSSELSMASISESVGPSMTADFIAAMIVTDELRSLNQIMFQILKNRYAGLSDDKFVMGCDYKRMKLYSLENSGFQKQIVNSKNKHPEIDNSVLNKTKPATSGFDNFNF